jgi:hypothetical protein
VKINDIIEKLKSDTTDNPKDLADYLVQLSASLYTSTELETDKEVEYVKKWDEIRNSATMTDKQAEMKAKQTDEYREWRRSLNTTKTIIELVRAIKKKLSNMEILYNEHTR